MLRILRRSGAALIAVGLLTSCGSGTGSTSTDASTPAEFPYTFGNCGASVTLEEPPQRIVLAQRNDVPVLAALGVLDRVIAKVGDFPTDLYDAKTTHALAQIPTIGGKQTTNGTTRVSLEAIVETKPDALFGVLSGSGLDRAALDRVGIPYVATPSQGDCFIKNPSFESVYSQLRLYGRMFDRAEAANVAITALRSRIAQVPTDTSAVKDKTAVAIFEPTSGREVTVYGRSSMVHAEMTAIGLRNLYAAASQRRFEVSFEDLLNKNPDYLIVLTLNDLSAAKASVTKLPGARSITAVRDGHVLPLEFDKTDPPTPLSVGGLERLAQEIGSAQP